MDLVEKCAAAIRRQFYAEACQYQGGILHPSNYESFARSVLSCIEEEGMVEAAYAARLVIAAKAQAYEEAITYLDMVEKCGAGALPRIIGELRRKHAALTANPSPSSASA